MKKITLLLALFIVSISFAQVSIGNGDNGSSTNSPPINAYYGFSYGQSIYLASEINASGNIMSIDFALETGADFSSADETVDVWIGHTTKSVFDNTTDWVDVSTLTQVLTSGTITSASDVLTITFSSPFAYNGTDNLIIAVDANESGFGGTSDVVLSTNGPSAGMSLMYRSDSTNPDPAAPPTGTLRQNRGNITFNGITQSCPAPSGLMATPSSATEADIVWVAGGSETGWTYEYGPTGFTQGSGTTDTAMMASASLSGLTEGETYDIYLQANCGGGDNSSFISITWDQVVPPANDVPSGAIAMTLDEGTECGANAIIGISNEATTDSGVAAPSCGSYSASDGNGDLWYTVTAPASGQITFNVENVTTTSIAGAFYSGTVGSLTEDDCTQFGSGWPWTVSGLTAGTTYYLRVWDFGNDQIGTFDLCGYFQSCLDPTAIAATVTSGTEATIDWTAGASETAWNYEWGDVGFTQGMGTTGTAMTNPTADIIGLTDGNEYDIYVQADCTGGSTSGWVKFTWTQIVPPMNDDCDNAIAITVNPDGTCAITSGTTVGATTSNVADDVTGTPNTDVWFTFVPYAEDMTIEITNVVNQGGGTSTSTDMGMGVYSGSGCNALTFVDDSDPNTLNLTGLAINDTYYIRVYGWSTSIQYNTFDICVKGPLPPIVPSYTETFDSYPANGWGEATGPYGSPSGTSSAWIGDDFANDTGHENGRAARINIFGTGTDEYLISPIFDLSGGDAYLNFDLAFTGFASTNAATLGPDDYVALLVTEDGGTNWTELARWDENTTISNTGEAFPEMILSGYGSEVQFAFYAFSDTSNVDNDFFIDNFRVLADTVLGTDDNTLEGFSLFPTVVQQELNFTARESVQNISIYNLLGQEVLKAAPNLSSSSINVSTLKGGVYIVRVQVGDSIGTYKIIKE